MRKSMNGYAGHIGRVNLTTVEQKIEETNNYPIKFIGGRGLNSWILFNELNPGTTPLEPENILVFGAGPFVGTGIPGSCYISIGSINTFTGGINYSHAGGHFAVAMKRAGFDHLIITGRSNKPVYLLLHEAIIEFRDATTIWGRTTWEAQDIIKSELASDDLAFALIGPAGENLVKGSIIIIDKTRAAGSGGLGAIMGSKNLKAIVVYGKHGKQRISIALPEKLSELLSSANKKIRSSDSLRRLAKNGTHSETLNMNERCLAPTRNVQDDHWDSDKMSSIDIATLKGENKNVIRLNDRIECCSDCPIQCGSIVYQVVNGPYRGLTINTFESNLALAFGSRCEINDPAILLKIFEQISLLGLDNDATGVVISWAIDCFERGLISRKETDGQDLHWGNGIEIVKLIKKIAYRKGFGDLLASGVQEASAKIGKNTDYIAIQCKGQDNLDALRAAKGWAFGNVVSLRGGRHLDGASTTELQGLSPKLGQKLYGVRTAGDPYAYEGKGTLTYWYSCFKAAIDCLGVCYFTSIWNGPDLLEPYDYAQLLSAVIGKDISKNELLDIGRRVVNTEKAFNSLHAGFSRKQDMPPNIFLNEAIKTGRFEGVKLEEDKWNNMLNEFYEAHEWDKRTGMQNRNILEKLDLRDVIEKLDEYNIFPEYIS